LVLQIGLRLSEKRWLACGRISFLCYISFSHECDEMSRNEWFWINFLQNVILNSCGVSPLPAVPHQAVPLTPSLTPFRGGLRGLSDTRNLRKAL
jgi:hypothetical protein